MIETTIQFKLDKKDRNMIFTWIIDDEEYNLKSGINGTEFEEAMMEFGKELVTRVLQNRIHVIHEEKRTLVFIDNNIANRDTQ